MYVYIYIYIYMRERERERDSPKNLNFDSYPHNSYVKMTFVRSRFDLQSTNSG